MDKKLEEMSVIEIKASIYDHMMSIERMRNNIQVLSSELVKREQKPSV